MLYLNTDSNKAIEPGAYDCIGIDGYLKADVFDGKGWKPMSLEEFFEHREYYFSKHEMPMDTIAVCKPLLCTASAAGDAAAEIPRTLCAGR